MLAKVSVAKVFIAKVFVEVLEQRVYTHHACATMSTEVHYFVSLHRLPACLHAKKGAIMATHTLEIGNVRRELPIIDVGDVCVALINLLGDTELTEAAAEALCSKLPADTDLLVTPEVKAVPLAHALSVRSQLPYIVARKTLKPYMVGAMSKTVLSITTGKPQDLFIDGNDVERIRGKRVIILDDVVSTGGTLRGLEALIAEIGGEVIATFAVCTEGDRRDDIVALGHLPLFPKDAVKDPIV